ncbi:MAG: metallophosphoesterase, partial [Oscillospiraceae bacterium]|nr:metallophosphoesterase [Oscillospiraceae bacterium]
MKNKKRAITVLIALALLAFLVLAFDCRLKVVSYEIENPKSEEPFRIVFISDLHSCSYGGKDMSKLIEKVRAQKPDAVLFGGDMFDSRRMPEDNSVTLMKTLGSEFPCYVAFGNHEVRHGKLDYYKEIAASCNVKVLDGTHTKTEVSALKILSGEFDCYFISGNHEVRHGKLDYYKEIVDSCGVKILDGI